MYYQQAYYEAIDNTISCLSDQFNQPGYRLYSNFELLLIKASQQQDFSEHFKALCDFYKDDFIPELLEAQLRTFEICYQRAAMEESGNVKQPTIFDIQTYFKGISVAQRSLLCQVGRVVPLIVVMPATNATSFSALRWMKTYLRSMMGQQRLKNLMVLHVHKDLCTLLQTLNIDSKALVNFNSEQAIIPINQIEILII